MSDLLHQNFGAVQSDKQPSPVTMASAATIAPTTRLTFVTGTVQVATITPPVTGYHELVFIFTDANPGALVTTGNIHTAYTPIQNQAFSLHYDPSTGKYWREAVT
jgi:hypothetical protein